MTSKTDAEELSSKVQLPHTDLKDVAQGKGIEMELRKEITSLGDVNKKTPDNTNEMEDELEDGELYDSDCINPEKAPICPFYGRNKCTWGSRCSFRHMGCLNMGNYVMFENIGLEVLPMPTANRNSNPYKHKTEIERSFDASLQELRQMMRESGYNLSKPKPQRPNRKPWLKVAELDRETHYTHRSEQPVERLVNRLPKLHRSTPYRPRQYWPKTPERIVTVYARRSSSSSSSTTDDYTSTTNSSSSSSASHPQRSKASARPSRRKNVLRATRKDRYLSSSSDSSSDTSTFTSELSSSDIELAPPRYNPSRYSQGRYTSRSRSTLNNNFQKKPKNFEREEKQAEIEKLRKRW